MSLNSLQLRHIRSFLAVAEKKSFIDASRELGVSQPALSQTIQHFEKVLAVRLFERTTRNVELTEIGAELFKKSGDLDLAIKQYFHELETLRNGARAKIKVGYLIGTGVQFIPASARRFEEKYPGASVELVEFDFNRPDAGLRGGEVDCAIVRPPIDIQDVELETLMHEKCVVCLPEHHSLCEFDTLTLNQIKNVPVVSALGAGVWRDYWLASDLLNGETLNVVFEVATLDSELLAVATQKGISITAESTAKYYARPGVTFRSLSDFPDCKISVGFRTDGHPRVADFVRIIRDVAERS